MVVWNFLSGVISASRVGGSDSPSSKQHAALARGTAGKEYSDVLSLNTRYFYSTFTLSVNR